MSVLVAGVAYILIGLCLAIGIGMEEHDHGDRPSHIDLFATILLWPGLVVIASGYRLSRWMR